MDRLETIELFLTVVETGSFSEAGRRLGHAPSAVSRRIDDLEHWMGANLFHRSTRRLTLTEVGHAFDRRSRQILLDLEEARVISAQLQDYPTGTIRMTASASFSPCLIGAMRDFQARWPGVRIIANITDRMADLVAEGQDLAIRVGRLQDSPLRAKLICRADRVICASPAYVKAHGAPERPEDLADLDCLAFRSSPGANLWRFRKARRRSQVRASGRFYCDNGRLLVQAACQGMGIVLAPRWLVGADLAAGRLISLLPGFVPDPADTPVHAVHAYTGFVPPKVRVFIDFLAGRFRGKRAWADIG